MGITVNWEDDSKTIIRCVYDGKWTWEQFFSAANEATIMQSLANHPIFMILDMRESIMPSGIVTRFRDIARIDQPNVAVRILVVNTTVSRKLYDIFASVYRPAAKNYQVVNSIDAAYKAIEDFRIKFSMA